MRNRLIVYRWKRGFSAALAAITLVAASSPLAAGEDDRSYLEKIREARARAESDLFSAHSEPLETVSILVSIGNIDEAEALLDSLRPESEADRAAALLERAEIALLQYDFAGAAAFLDEAAVVDPASEELFRLRIVLLNRREDLARIDTLTTARLDWNGRSVAALLGRAGLDYNLLRMEAAEKKYEEALALAREPADGVRALAGLMRIAYKKNRYDDAATLAVRALEAGLPTTELLNDITSVLIRLGEVSDAIAIARETLLWDRWNERAHYLLGNGYTGKNYTELETASPGAFPDSTGTVFFDSVRAALRRGDRAAARTRLVERKGTAPGLVETDLILGTIDWEEGRSDSAIARFAAALEICPEFGRAHNGFAKAMEQKRLAVHEKSDRYEEEFAATPSPRIDRIEQFVLNYDALSARHRKQVALSIEPWAPFIPVLVEAGATCSIKPLYERLSESPHQHLLRDLRISYDSRLWDDVRGCGGYHTVTGVEDVERTIFRKYNTVLHELSHQVHSIVTAEEKREIQEAYRAAKEREDSGEKAFLSRYQGSSVYEYFAEGMNSYASPKQDAYDTREIVRERLSRIDPELEELIEKIASPGSVEKYYVPAYVISAYDRIENGKLGEALERIDLALGRERDDESALCALAYTKTLLEDHEGAEEAAVQATRKHGRSAEPWIENARSVYHRTGSRSEEIAILLRAREEVDRGQRYQIELALGNAYIERGDLSKASEAYGWVLRYQEDNPEALWGLGRARGLASEVDEATDSFEKAIRRRNGISELRADYARFLTRQNRFEEAEEQIAEARLLDSKSSDVEAAAGMLAIYRREWDEAKRRLADAVAFAPWNDMATILLAHTWIAEGERERAEELLGPVLAAVDGGARPVWRYFEAKGEYREIHRYPAEERWLLYLAASELADAKGDSAEARRFRRLRDQSFR